MSASGGGRRRVPDNGRRPVGMLAHAYYEEDSRVRRQAEALVAAGRPVDVYGLRRPGDGPEQTLAGVRVHRLPVRRHQGAGPLTYLAEYLDFFFRAAWAATRAHATRRYALLEVHSLPDWLVFAALPIKLTGVPILLDLHEAMPEFFATRFPRLAGTATMALLRLTERLSIGLADAILTVNESLAERLARLGVPRRKITVVVNGPDQRLFDPAAHPTRSWMADGTLRLIYAGAITPLYDLPVVADAVARLRGEVAVHLDVYGRGDGEETLRRRCAELGIERMVTIHGRIPLEEVAAAIAVADVGLAPVRHVPYTDLSLSTKLLEYTAMGKPVVAARLPTVERYFGPDGLVYFAPGDASSLAGAIRSLVTGGSEARAAQVARARGVVARLSWDLEGQRYLALVGRLASGDGL